MKRFRKDDIHITPDVSHVQNPDVAHEASDVDVGAILKFVVGLVVMTVVVHFLMLGLLKVLERQARIEEPKPAPMALGPDERLPPEPRLQAAPGFGVSADKSETAELREKGFKVDEKGRVDLEKAEPEAEMKVVREEWNKELEHGRKDPQTGATLAKPIDEAMKELVETGLPARPQTGGDNPLAKGADIPTYQSSGRMTEKRKQ